MTLFALAKLLSPVGGGIGGAIAAHRAVPSSSTWPWVAFFIGFAFGIGCYLGLTRLAIGKHDKDPNIPSWRIATVLGIAMLSPYITGVLSYGLFRLFFHLVA